MSSISKYLIASLSLLSIIINGQDVETESPSSTITSGGSGYSYYIDSFTLDADSSFDVPYPTDVCVLTSAISDTYVMYTCNTEGDMITKIEYGTDSDCMTAVTTGTPTSTGNGLYTKNGWTCVDDASLFLTLQFGSCSVANKDINVVPYICYQDSVTSSYMKFFCNDIDANDEYESISWGTFSSSVCQTPSSSLKASASCAAFGTTGVNVTAVMDGDSCTDMTPVTTTTSSTTSTTSSSSTAETTAATTAGESKGNYINNIMIVMICLLSLIVTIIIQ